MVKKQPITLRTKTVSEVPFRSELYSFDCSHKLLNAAGRKSYFKFVRDCSDPDLLLEVMMLKRNQSHFPDLMKINSIYRAGSNWSILIRLIAGKKRQKQFMCAWLRAHMPKQQYPVLDYVKTIQNV